MAIRIKYPQNPTASNWTVTMTFQPSQRNGHREFTMSDVAPRRGSNPRAEEQGISAYSDLEMEVEVTPPNKKVKSILKSAPSVERKGVSFRDDVAVQPIEPFVYGVGPKAEALLQQGKSLPRGDTGGPRRQNPVFVVKVPTLGEGDTIDDHLFAIDDMQAIAWIKTQDCERSTADARYFDRYGCQLAATALHFGGAAALDPSLNPPDPRSVSNSQTLGQYLQAVRAGIQMRRNMDRENALYLLRNNVRVSMSVNTFWTRQQFQTASGKALAHRYQLLKDLDQLLDDYQQLMLARNLEAPQQVSPAVRNLVLLSNILDKIAQIFRERPNTDRRAALETLSNQVFSKYGRMQTRLGR